MDLDAQRMSAPTVSARPNRQADTNDRKRRHALAACFALAAAVLVACSAVEENRFATGLYRLSNSTRNPSIETMEHTVEYSVVQASRAMVHAPNALLVLERNLGPAFEQRIILPNDTAVRGDNVMQLRAQTDDSVRLNEFNFEEIVARFGGLPSPFERLTTSLLLSGQDNLGTYVYARENLGTNTVCVLALRRMTVGVRPLPRGSQAMDVMLRNCVVGTVDDALAPLAARGLATGSSGQRMLSPFAAPQG